MKNGQVGVVRSLGRLAKALVLWTMLASGIVLATRQARADHVTVPSILTGVSEVSH